MNKITLSRSSRLLFTIVSFGTLCLYLCLVALPAASAETKIEKLTKLEKQLMLYTEKLQSFGCFYRRLPEQKSPPSSSLIATANSLPLERESRLIRIDLMFINSV